MGFLQLLASLWPFLKEMIVGEKIKDEPRSKTTATAPAQPKSKASSGFSFGIAGIAIWSIGKMQESRRFLAFVVIVLILSLFVNYKVIGKLAVLMPRDEKHIPGEAPPSKEPKEVPTVPHKESSDRDVLFEQTVKELKDLYGAGQ